MTSETGDACRRWRSVLPRLPPDLGRSRRAPQGPGRVPRARRSRHRGRSGAHLGSLPAHRTERLPCSCRRVSLRMGRPQPPLWRPRSDSGTGRPGWSDQAVPRRRSRHARSPARLRRPPAPAPPAPAPPAPAPPAPRSCRPKHREHGEGDDADRCGADKHAATARHVQHAPASAADRRRTRLAEGISLMVWGLHADVWSREPAGAEAESIRYLAPPSAKT